ncbi:hypothetical protein M9Y10_005009 [Tritrichomonas musculus]|uniref:TPR Domain containing protein n=1 Tax=Tritrichomonas musculus TaxID=1915356 RepID=A0ABR2JK98_9EUKA
MSQPTKSKDEIKKLKEIEKLQTSRDYANGLRISTKLVKNYPKSAEALAWKAYFTYMKAQGEKPKDEVLQMQRSAIQLDMKSAQAWRTSALLFKEMQDYENALKCSNMSLRNNPNDITTLNDIANLNLYSKNYSEFLKNTRAIFEKNPNNFSILRYLFALAMAKNYKVSNSSCGIFQDGWKPTTSEDEFLFRSEFCLFRCILFMRSEQYQECLDYLEKSEVHIRDLELLKENKIKCLQALNRDKSEILPLVHELLKVYPEDGDYFDILEKLTDPNEYVDLLLKLKTDLKSRYAHVRALELMDLTDERFKPLLLEHLNPLFIKGAPAIYMTIRDFSKEKMDVCLDYVLNTLLPAAPSEQLPITSIPIAHLFAAHVYGFRGDFDKAIEHLDTGLKHTPTCIELISWKAKFQAKFGHIKEAVSNSCLLATSDPNDRNANLLYVKHLFLNGQRKEALAQATIFAGNESGKSLVYDTQFNSYYLQSGYSSLRANDFEFAHKMYSGVLKHFEEYRKNEFTYLGWGWRKPRVLLEMIETINNIENNESLARAIEMLLTIAIKDNKHNDKDTKEIAKRSLVGGKPRALYMACIIFAQEKLIMPALRCFLKIADTPFVFAAIPEMKTLMANKDSIDKKLLPIVEKEYHEIDRQPSTFFELFYAAKGQWAIGNIEEALKLLNRAIDEHTVRFKDALELYVFATILSGNDQIKTEVERKLKEKYPSFEFDIEEEKEPEVQEQK